MKKPVKEMGPAYGAPIKWKVTYEHEDGSTTSTVVLQQTAFLARREGALKLGRLASEVTTKPLDPSPEEVAQGKKK